MARVPHLAFSSLNAERASAHRSSSAKLLNSNRRGWAIHRQYVEKPGKSVRMTPQFSHFAARIIELHGGDQIAGRVIGCNSVALFSKRR
jgi:hypothetical protein